MVVTKSEFTHRQVKWLFTHGPKAGWLDSGPCPSMRPSRLRRLIGGCASPSWQFYATACHRVRTPSKSRSLTSPSVSAASLVAEKNAAKQAWVAALVHWTQWSESDLETLLGKPGNHVNTGQLVAVFPADYVVSAAGAVARVFSLLKRFGDSAELGCTLAAREVFDRLNADAVWRRTRRARFSRHVSQIRRSPMADPGQTAAGRFAGEAAGCAGHLSDFRCQAFAACATPTISVPIS